MATARVMSVNIGHAVDASWAGALKRTAIDRRPVAAAVPAGVPGLAGDEQADEVDHGGPDQARYAHAREDPDWWGGRLGRWLPAGMSGENITTAGLDLNGGLTGEIWRFGMVEAWLVGAVRPAAPTPG